MKLSSGVRLGPYEVVAPIGAGGMGEVYRACDTRLGRTVAIKILPSEFAQDAKLKIRFEREAKAISALSHPHICALYDVGPDYLVMEHCEGKTLAKRVAEAPLSIERIVEYGIQIADALDKAHRQGIIHRDLKPSNIMITKSGIKLLDFGLAKATVDSSPGDSTEQQLTEEGKILGTVQYMAPELFHGKEADARSDIFAFGLIVYEMATGKPAFTGASKASLIAAILEHEPKALAELKPASPPALGRLIQACLSKDPDERIQTAHDVLLQLRWMSEAASPHAEGGRRGRGLFWLFGVLAIVTITGVLAPFVARRSSPPPVARTAITFPLPLHLAGNLQTFAISPDGRDFACTLERADGKTQIYLRSIGELEAKAISGTENGHTPFFSPDGRWLGFFAEKKLRKVPVAGGSAITICDADRVRGATWGTDETIVFATMESPLLRVSAGGGSPVPVTRNQKDHSHRWPVFLPDGRHVLFTDIDTSRTAYADDQSGRDVAIVDLRSGATRVIVRDAYYGRYSSTGHVLFTRSQVVFAAPFNSKTAEITGPAVPLLHDVRHFPPAAASFYATTDGETVAYLAKPPPPQGELVLVDRNGSARHVEGPRAFDGPIRVSPDGKRVVVTITENDRSDLWVHDIDGKSWTRLTSDADNFPEAWSPDGAEILFASDQQPPFNDYLIDSSGAGGRRQITHRNPVGVANSSWVGRVLVFDTQTRETGWDIWSMDLNDESTARPFLNTSADEQGPALSPDGHWLAYRSDQGGSEEGRQELYVRAYPGPGPAWPITHEGAEKLPRWSRDGRKLYYRKGDKLMEVDVKTSPTFSASRPRVILEIPFSSYDVAADGRLMVVKDLTRPKPPTEIIIARGVLPAPKRFF